MILDTNALTAFVDGESEILQFVEKAQFLALPVIVLGEYRYGISRSSRKAEYEDWLENELSSFRVLEVSEITTRHYAKIRLHLKEVGTPIPENDVWIAALAAQFETPILSKDKHFSRIKGISVRAW